MLQNKFLPFFLDAPSVDVYPTSSTVVEGNNITLSCNASGKPEPSVSWTRVGQSGQSLSQSSTLTITNVSRPGTPHDLIQYQCEASNGVGNHAAAIVNVTVHCKYALFILFSLVLVFLATNNRIQGVSIKSELVAAGLSRTTDYSI